MVLNVIDFNNALRENQTNALENYTIFNDEMAKDIKEIKQSNIAYEDLLKFDTFKIMP